MNTTQLGRTGRTISRIGLGGMPLSIQGRPEDRGAAKRVIQRAVELGVTFIDTADAYALDETDVGHNERLIAEALREIGSPPRVVVATKGGMTRPEGRWERDGSPAHLREACERSLRALGVERIDLYQFHAPDPKVPFLESVGEMARLLADGLIAAVGLSNVTLAQLQEAERIVPITSVQNRFNPWDREAEESGLVRYCDENEITFLPYSPVGGGRRVKLLRASEPLRRLGERFGATPEELVLAWILSVSPSLVPIPGASRVASIESSIRAEALRLDDDARAALDEIFRTLPD